MEGSQENSFFFFSNKKELYIYVMGENDPVEKKRSIDDRMGSLSQVQDGGKFTYGKKRGQVMTDG